MQATTPLFSNDVQGYIKAVIFIVGPIAGTVLWYLRKGPDGEIKDMKKDMEGFGRRLNADEAELAATNARVDALYTTMAGYQRDIMDGIKASSQEQLKAVHSLEIQIAVIQSQNSIAKTLSEIGDKIVEAVIHRAD